MVAPGLELTCIFYLVPHEKATAITSARGLKICKPGGHCLLSPEKSAAISVNQRQIFFAFSPW
jgi:hypothetical protein